MRLPVLLEIAGLLHLGLIAAGASMPRVVGLRAHLSPLPVFIRRLFWVYYAFIGFCLVSFGALTFFLAEPLASGTPLARAVCGFLCGFWTIRLVSALLVLDVRPYLTGFSRRLGYQATNLVFLALPVIYGFSALAGGSP